MDGEQRSRESHLTSVNACLDSLKKIKTPKNLRLVGDHFSTDDGFISIKIAGKPNRDVAKLFIDMFANHHTVIDTLEGVSSYLQHESQCGQTGSEQINSETLNTCPSKETMSSRAPAKMVDTDATTPSSARKEGRGQTTGNEEQAKELNKLKEENHKLKESLQTRDMLRKEILEGMKRPYQETEVLQKLTAKVSDLTDRLAAEMNARISSNESSFENIGIKNRPMNIADEYGLMMSNAWVDAKCTLDKKWKDDTFKLQILCQIMLECERKARDTHTEVMAHLAKLLREPLQLLSNNPQLLKSGSVKSVSPDTMPLFDIPVAVSNSVGDCLRVSADTIDTSYLLQELIPVMARSQSEHHQSAIVEALTTEPVDAYIKQCARLTWKMVTQRPPMRFDTSLLNHRWSGRKDLNLMYGSEPRQSGATIRCYKQPSLMHGDKILMKGHVYVR